MIPTVGVAYQKTTQNFQENIAELNSVAGRNFECYVKGLLRPQTSHSAQMTTIQPLPNKALSNVSISKLAMETRTFPKPRNYARAAASEDQQVQSYQPTKKPA